MEGQLVVTTGLLAPFVLEGVKLVVRRFVLRDEEYDFSPLFYELMVPFTSALTAVALGFLGWVEMPVIGAEALLQWALAIVLQLGTYHLSLRPFKEYRRTFTESS